MIKNLFTIVFLAGGLLGCGSSSVSSGNDNAPTRDGIIYVSTNDPTNNYIVAMARLSTGELRDMQEIPTNGLGDADDGDFDSQYALRLVDIGTNRYLLAVNAGEHNSSTHTEVTHGNGSISVFSVNKSNGTLTFLDLYDSQGVRPVSVDAFTTNNTTWVIVGNQHSNPFCNVSTATTLTNCGGNNITANLSDSSESRNIVAFQMDSNGALTNPHVLWQFDGLNGGVSQVDVSPDGLTLAATLWGIPHIVPTATITTSEGQSVVSFWNINAGSSTLSLTHKGSFSQAGVSGSIGFEWESNSNHVYATNFNLAPSQDDYSVTVISSTGSFLSSAATEGVNDEACWALRHNDELYTVSFNLNVISAFDVNATNGDLSNYRVYQREDGIPNGDSKDAYAAGGYLYVSGGLRSHRIVHYPIQSDGSLTNSGNPGRFLPNISSGNNDLGTVSESEQAFLGLVGFEF